MSKRKDYISWDEYFISLAILSGMRSKDPSTQVGACIVDKNNKVLSLGYNGAPIGYDDDSYMTWDRDGDFLNTKYAYVCHAELNAILNSHTSLKESKIYVYLFPCNECAKLIIQSGIKEIIYVCDKYKDTDSVKASKKMLDACGVKYTEYKLHNKNIVINV
ncbi:MAG: dCMP deaminase family protein [Clostridium sp.]|nr:dCMP deaminase family protein [Clostridium sp.]MCM1444621.1 dCMP deaminase family protein [Candidatus Amulumruptor caecigallinarius]